MGKHAQQVRHPGTDILHPCNLRSALSQRWACLCEGLASLLLCLCAVISAARAQVLPANEIQDPTLSALQARNMDALKQMGAEILKLPTEYLFSPSHKLDLEESKQKWADQRSIQFDHYQDKIVLKITGNYLDRKSTRLNSSHLGI